MSKQKMINDSNEGKISRDDWTGMNGMNEAIHREAVNTRTNVDKASYNFGKTKENYYLILILTYILQ